MGSSIDTVVFDLGGVLINVDHAGALQWLRSKGGVVRDVAGFAADTGMHEHETGGLSGAGFYDRVQALLTEPVTTTQLHEWWTGFFSPDDNMLRLARALGQSYRVFILSNTGPLHWEQAMQQFRLDEIARDCLTSFEAGVAKPDARIYALAARRFALQPRRTVFIDDLRPNVDAAEAAGWHSLQHRGFETTAVALTRVGVRA